MIDFEKLKLGKPWLAFDLPAGGKRLLQKADGYVATIKSGEVTFRDGEYLRRPSRQTHPRPATRAGGDGGGVGNRLS